MINWRVRVNNKAFWMAIVPAVALLAQAVASVFGWELDLSDMTGRVLAVVDAVFAVLVVLGVVVDPTTEGLGDSARALKYIHPSQN